MAEREILSACMIPPVAAQEDCKLFPTVVPLIPGKENAPPYNCPVYVSVPHPSVDVHNVSFDMIYQFMVDRKRPTDDMESVPVKSFKALDRAVSHFQAGDVSEVKAAEMPAVHLADDSGETIRVLQVDDYNLAVWLPATNQELEFRSLPSWKARTDDVIVCAYPKAGTHWLWEIITMLYNGKADRIWENKETAMIEFLPQKDYDNLQSPRILNTHLFFHQLPPDTLTKKSKLVFIQRDPKDIAVSFYNHHRKLVMYEYDGKWENYFNRFLDGKVDFGSWFEYTLDWETAIKNHPEIPIHVMFYENLKQNGFEEIQRLADFLGVNADKELITSIEEMCQFSTMKKDKDQMELLDISRDKKPLFYRKGEIGDWKNWFTVAQSEKFDEVFKEKTKTSETKMLFSQYL